MSSIDKNVKFWEEIKIKLAQVGLSGEWKERGGEKVVLYNMSQVPGVWYSFCLAKHHSFVRVYFGKIKAQEINKKRFDYLNEFKEKIETDLGTNLSWRRMPDNNDSCIEVKLGYGVDDNDKRQELQEKMIDLMSRMKRVFDGFIKVLSI